MFNNEPSTLQANFPTQPHNIQKGLHRSAQQAEHFPHARIAAANSLEEKEPALGITLSADIFRDQPRDPPSVNLK